MRQVLMVGAALAMMSAAPGRCQEEGWPPDLAPLVLGIELRSDVPLRAPERLLDLVAVEIGEPLTSSSVRTTLRSLSATGVASEIEAYTRTVGDGGVVLVLAVWGNVLVEDVGIEGALGLDREALRREVLQHAGQPLVEDRIVRSVYRLLDRYREAGYFEARVRARVEVDEDRNRADVVFAVESGARARVGAVELAGGLGPFSAAALVDPLRAKPGEHYRQSLVRGDLDRLRQWLLERGHRAAEVELIEERWDAPSNTVDLGYRVEVGPLIEVEVVGADEDRLRKRGLLPFLGDEGYDEVLVIQAIERIERWYQERGHYLVEVERDGERTDGRLRVVLEVRPGPVYVLEEVEFEGNEEVSDQRLGDLMTTVPRRLVRPGSGRLVTPVLEEDLKNIRDYYALDGWTRARVGPPEILREDDRLRLVIPIEEGPRSRVVGVDVSGNLTVLDEELLAGLAIAAGGPFHPRLLEESLDRIRSRYESRGFAGARVSATTDWNAERTLVDVEIRVIEGPRQLVDQLIVRGTRRTKTAIVDHFAALEPGEPLSRRRLLEVQRNLYRLGVFSRVEVEPAPSGEPEERRDVVIRVVEGLNRRVAYGAGYDTEEGFGGLFAYSHSNLWGRATRFQLDLRASERFERYRLLLRQPFWGGRWPGSIDYLVFQEAERRPSFEVEKVGGQLHLRRGRDDLAFGLFFDYRQVDLEPLLGGGDELEDLPLDQQRALQDIEIFSIVPRVTRDRRNDPLDPRAGDLAIVQLQYALPIEEIAEENFLKLFGQYAKYWEVMPGQVVAGSVRIGGIEPFGGRAVSVAERFFAGGRSTHRAYGRDELGIFGETLTASGEPLGGKGLLLVNLDYRFPLVGPLGGVVFADAGNVWFSWRDIDPMDMKVGVGTGLRYLSPIGPIRLEAGWKLDREPAESAVEIFVSFGSAF